MQKSNMKVWKPEEGYFTTQLILSVSQKKYKIIIDSYFARQANIPH